MFILTEKCCRLMAIRALKKYPHFYGHYGTAWQNQHKEFPKFPGAILMTTNCIQKTAGGLHGNIFTCGLVGWPDVPHIANRNFTPVIEKALRCRDLPKTRTEKTVMVGFGRNTVLSVADKVIEAVKNKDIQSFLPCRPGVMAPSRDGTTTRNLSKRFPRTAWF